MSMLLNHLKNHNSTEITTKEKFIEKSSGKISTTFNCNECSKPFLQKSGLEKHQSLKHTDSPVDLNKHNEEKQVN